MNQTGKLTLIATLFYLAVTGLYWFWSQDPTGSLMLLFSGAMALILTFFLLNVSKRVYPTPEDDPDALPEDADIDYGFYSPHSWWPLPLALSCAMIVFGLAFAAWIVVAGTVFLMLSLVGWVFEYYRGDFSH